MPRVFFLILDAFDPARLSPRLTPNLWRWANADGAVVGTGRAVMASCTYPNHASFVTGLEPSGHGIYANHVIRNGVVRGAWEVGPGGPTIFDRFGGESAAVLGDHHLVGVMGATAATSHWPADGNIHAVVDLDPLGYPDDSAVLPPLLEALAGEARLVVGYFGSIDTYSHIFGPDSVEAEAAYRRVDAKMSEVDRILDWDDTVVLVVSDHVQQPVVGPGINLRSQLGDEITVVDEGSAALIAGLADPGLLAAIDGVEGWDLLGDGHLLAWCGRDRFFGPFEEPILKGAHGGTYTRTQLAMVTGGNPAKHLASATVESGPVPPTFWAPTIETLLATSR